MTFVEWLTAKRHYTYALGILLAGGLLLGNGGLHQSQVSAQAADSLYLTPAAGSYPTGSTITVSIRENSSEALNSVQADLKYSNNLEFVSIDGGGSAFGIDASSYGGSGSVTISRGSTDPVSGDKLVSKVNFKVLSGGTGSVEVMNSSLLLSMADSRDVLKTRSGASYGLQGAVVINPAASSTRPQESASSSPASSAARASSPSVTIAPQGSGQPSPLPGDTMVELEAPATIETTPAADRQVAKVEYLLNGKLVATDTTPPYSHSIDTASMRNGTYALVTKTYYLDGQTDSSNASLVVRNPFGVMQFWLQLRHYAWLAIILLVVAGELIYLKFFKTKKLPYGNGGNMGGGTPVNTSGHGTVVVGGGPSYY